MLKWLRWLGVAPAAVLGWYIALAAGLALLSFVDSLCPPADVVSGMCFASWYPFVSRSVMCLGAGLAGALVVALSTAVAPSQRLLVAWAAYACGAVVALYVAAATSAYVEFVSAVLAGALVVAIVRVFWRVSRLGA